MLLYDSFTIALRYSVKLPFSQFARVPLSKNCQMDIGYLQKVITRIYIISNTKLWAPDLP